MKKESVISWHFEHLLKGHPGVSARINAPQSNPKLKIAYISYINMYELPRMNDYPGERLIVVKVNWFPNAKATMGSVCYGFTLFETLQNAGADKLGCIQKGSFEVWWKLKKGEKFQDGSIRIAKLLIKLLDIKIVENPAITNDMLISLFVSYKIIWVKHQNGGRERIENTLRRKHNLPEAPIQLFMNVL